MKVLIVDDEVYMLEYIKNLTDWAGYGFDQVITAAGGSLARDLLMKHKPELLITDIKMPKITGLDLVRLIQEEGYETKTIILSGYSEFEYAQQAVRYGVSEYLVKPLLREDLESTLNRILDQQVNQPTEDYLSGDRGALADYLRSYIQEYYDQDLSLDTLGHVVKLHPAYLSRVFKEMTEMNLSAYITEVRMDKAAELLSDTDQRVQDIAQRMGYQKLQHFSKLFRNKYGVTPTEYRMGKRQEEAE